MAEYKDGKHLIKFEDGEETVSFGCLWVSSSFFVGQLATTALPLHLSADRPLPASL